MKRFISLSLIISLLTIFIMVNFSFTSFAEDDDGWIDTSSTQLVDAFVAYCKSRDITMEGSIADAFTSSTTQLFNSLCTATGIDSTSLQAEIKQRTDQNAGLQYLLTVSGASAFNRLCAQLLQDNDLSVGDSANDVVYSSKWITDDNGNSALVWIINGSMTSNRIPALKSNITKYGTYLKYSKYQLRDIALTITNNWGSKNLPFTFNGTTVTGSITKGTADFPTHNGTHYTNGALIGSSAEYYLYANIGAVDNIIQGGVIIYSNSENSNTYSLGMMALNNGYGTLDTSRFCLIYRASFTLNNVPSSDITIVSPTIKPALPEDEPTIIDPNGRSPEPDPEPSGGIQPDWNTDTQIEPNENGDGWNIPFTLPDLNIDWSITGLTEKFPFCIPFDIVSFCSALSSEPTAPRIQGSIPIGTLYTWNIDYDFSQFNSWAVIFRNIEYIGFIIGLIYLTIKLVRG